MKFKSYGFPKFSPRVRIPIRVLPSKDLRRGSSRVIQRLLWFLRTIVDLFYCLSYVVSNLWVFRYTGSISSNFKHTNQFIVIWRSFIQISCVRAFAYWYWVGRFECAAKYGASILGSTNIVRNSHAESL